MTPAEGVAMREALTEIRGIIDRDDFGDSWEHDDWVFRDAAEKKLSQIEEVLDKSGWVVAPPKNKGETK